MAFGGPVAAQVAGTPGVPTGFGLAGNVVGLSLSGSFGPERGNPPDTNFDASSALTFGFGNPVSGLGVQVGANLTSFRNFGQSGFLTFGVHRMFQLNDKGVFSVAANVNNIAPWGDSRNNDLSGSLVGSYLTGFGPRLGVITLGVGNSGDAENDVLGIFAIGAGITPTSSVGIGQVGDTTSLGVTLAPAALRGGSIAVSVNRDWNDNENTLVVDLGRIFSLKRK